MKGERREGGSERMWEERSEGAREGVKDQSE